jgi:NTP pyrophosphatase (non-canonical NTP hydrolase)
MDLDAYVRAAKRTVNPSLDERDRLLDAAAGFAEEAGEVLGLIRKKAFQDRDIPREKLVEELGDALWCLAVAARCIDVPLSEVAARNLDKLRTRHPKGFEAR